MDKAAELIDAGLFELATAVAGPKETGVPVVPFQGGHGGGDENALDLLPLDAGRTNRPVKELRIRQRLGSNASLRCHWLESDTVTAVLLLGVIINIYRPTKACSSPTRSPIQLA